MYLTLTIELTNETWVEELGAGPNEATRAFALGIQADETNTNTCQEHDAVGDCIKGGWMDVVQPTLAGPFGYLMIERQSDTLVRVRLPPFETYDVFAPDLINIYIPPRAVFSDQQIIASTQSNMHTPRTPLACWPRLTARRARAVPSWQSASTRRAAWLRWLVARC